MPHESASRRTCSGDAVSETISIIASLLRATSPNCGFRMIISDFVTGHKAGAAVRRRKSTGSRGRSPRSRYGLSSGPRGNVRHQLILSIGVTGLGNPGKAVMVTGERCPVSDRSEHFGSVREK